MSKNFVQNGDVLTLAAPEAVTSGRGILIGTLFGIAQGDAESGALVDVKTDGVWTHAKTSAQAWTVGAAIYWDNTAKVFTTVSTGGNVLVGKAVAIAADPSPTGTVRLNG